jgi:hypothetical protein
MKVPSRSARDAAESLAIQALTFIAEEPQRLALFLDITGIAARQIRAAAREPGFLAGVLEHMMNDENLLIAFAASRGCGPAEIAQAHQALVRS